MSTAWLALHSMIGLKGGERYAVLLNLGKEVIFA